MKKRVHTPLRRGLLLLGMALCATVGTVSAQGLGGELPPEIQTELRYASGLNQLGLPDYAEIILARMKTVAPEAKAYIRVIELQGFLAMGRFDEVRQVIAQEPNQRAQETWAMKLALADGLYAWGKYLEAREIYDHFFLAYPDGPPDELNHFYLESAYKYTQMLLLMGEEAQAAQAYRTLLKAKLETHIRRQVLSELAEVLVKLAEAAENTVQRQKYFDEITTLNNEILWVQDLWFGKAIVTMAHVKLIQGDIDGTAKLLEDYRSQLLDVDAALREQAQESGEDLTKLSPMAECRYLLGVMMQERAEALLAEEGADRRQIVTLLAGKALRDKKRTSGALQHFLNVFIGYPGTSWAPDAGTRARQVEALLKKEFNARIETKVSDEQMAKVERFQFQNARSLYNQARFSEAAEAYLKVLNLFPEKETSIGALGELSRCYAELQDDLYGDVISRYLAERFCRHPVYSVEAGDQTLKTAALFGEKNRRDREEVMYDRFFEFFPRHPRAAGILYRSGEECFRDEAFDEAVSYYQQVATNYVESPLRVDALNRITQCYARTGERVNEIKALQAYLAVLEKTPRPGQALVVARYRVANGYRDQGSDYLRMDDPGKREIGNRYVGTAVNKYAELAKLLADTGDEYATGAEERRTNEGIREACLFYKAVCYSMLVDRPEATLKQYKQEAIKGLNVLVETFPDSKFTPTAYSQMGTLWTLLDEPKQAQATLMVLQKKYPESNEAKNAKFMLGKNLLELGRRQQAVRVFKEMFEGTGTYSDVQILTAGQELLKAKEYDIAIRAFDKVLASSQKRVYREPAMLNKAVALLETGDNAKAVDVLEQMLADYPNSGLTVTACLHLNKAYGVLGMNEPSDDARFDLFNNAVKAMKTARSFADTKDLQAMSDVEVARILSMKALAEEKFGSESRASEYRNEAIAAYQTLILLGDPNDPETRPHIEDAYNDCIPLLARIERWDNVMEDCDQYLAFFPRGRYAVDVKKWRNRAQVRLATSRVTTAPPTSGPAPGGRADGPAL